MAAVEQGRSLCTHFPVEIPCSARALQSHVVDIKYLDYSAWAGSVLWGAEWVLWHRWQLGAFRLSVLRSRGRSGMATLAWWHPCSADHWRMPAPSDSYSTAGLSRPRCHLQENNTSEKKKTLEIVFSTLRFQVLQLFRVNTAFSRKFPPCHWIA